MRGRRKLLVIIVAILMLFTYLYISSATLAYADDGDDSVTESEEFNYRGLFYYKLIDDELHITRAVDDNHYDEDGNITLTDRCLITRLEIPETLDVNGTSYPVEYIDGSVWDGTGAFKDCFNLTYLSLPSSLKSIGDKAFAGCTNLTNVRLPDGLEFLGSGAFQSCTVLESVNIPKNCRTHEYAGEQAYPGPFANTPALESVVLEDGRESIGNGFFEYSGMKEITIPDSVTSMGSWAFYGTENLEMVHFSENSALESIGWKAFCGSGVKSFTMPDTVNFVDVGAFAGCERLETVRLSASMTCNQYQTERGYDTGIFQGCTSLTNIIFPEGLTEIGRCWFFDSPIKTITIPASVTEIDSDAFRCCLDLEEVVFEEGCSLETIGATAFRKDASLETFSFPNTLKTIKAYAFENSGLTSAVLPDSLETMYAGVFNGCADLASVTIPAGMTYEWGYDNGAFEGSNSLKTVVFKPGVTKIDAGLFGWNEGIVDIEIPEGVTSIGARAFRRARSLKTVTLPKTLQTIDDDAFSDCDSLETLVFRGSRPEVTSSICSGTEAIVEFGTWDAKPDNWGGTLTFVGRISSDPSDTVKVRGSFTTTYDDKARLFSVDKGFVYKDAYFSGSTLEYNHSLATMSLCMAFSAYAAKPYESYDTAYDPTYDANILNLMSQCGFANDDCYRSYRFNEVPSESSIACAIGRKSILVDDQEVTLIAVAVRSGGYEDEWASNFRLGSSGDHEGFDWGAEQVKTYIRDYIVENKISGDVKIWITGFSRGAAVATHTAAKLDDQGGFRYKDESSETGYARVNYDKDSIYAYGFATPAGACKASKPHSSKYGNIWNVIEYNDPVPLVAPGKWGFDRYGTTMILPYRESNDLRTYKAYFARMKTRLNAGYGYNIEDFTNYHLVPANTPDKKNHDTQGTVLRKSINAVADAIGDRAKYFDKYELEVMAFVENKMGGEVMDYDLGEFTGSLIKDFLLIKLPQLTVQHPKLVATVTANLSTLFEVHADQDYYVGWMQLMDTNYPNPLPLVWGDPCYRVFKGNCPVDLYVYDTDGEIVASIVDDEPSANTDQSIVVSVDENGQKVAYLPNSGNYRVVVEAREACDVSCGIEEVNAERGNPVRSTTFETTSLAAHASMEAEIPPISDAEMDTAAEEGSGAQYSMNKDGGEVEIENDLHGADAISGRTFEITTTCDEAKGQVYGGGSFIEGSFVRLEAVGTDQYYCEGFYIDGVRCEGVDDENPDVIRFKVTGDTVVEARFAEKTAIPTPSVTSGLVYNGKKQIGVSVGDGYTVQGGTATNAGNYTAAVTPAREYMWDNGTCKALELNWAIKPAAVSSVVLSKTSFVYTGKVQKPSVKSVNAGSVSLKSSDYKVSYSNASSKAAALYKVTVTGKGNFTGTKTVSYKIAQAANKATAAKASVKKTFKATKLKKKSAKVTLPKVSARFGTAKWKVTAKDKKGVLSLKGKKIVVKKGAKKGTYRIKLKASVAGTKNYKGASTKVVKVTVRVK